MRKTLQAIAILMLVPACAGTLPAYQQTAVPGLDEASLTALSTQDGFLDVLRESGATNIVLSRGMLGEQVAGAVTADHLEHVYLFLDGVYLDRVEVVHDPGRSPVHPTLKVVVAGGAAAVMLIAEQLEIEGRASGLLAFFDEKGVRRTTTLPLSGFSLKHGGIKDPYIGGTDLETGILFSARSEEGRTWSKVYVLSLADRKLDLDDMSPQQACFCSSYLSWKQGKDGRTLFGMVVE
jgi:hypothetical protein